MHLPHIGPIYSWVGCVSKRLVQSNLCILGLSGPIRPTAIFTLAFRPTNTAPVSLTKRYCKTASWERCAHLYAADIIFPKIKSFLSAYQIVSETLMNNAMTTVFSFLFFCKGKLNDILE